MLGDRLWKFLCENDVRRSMHPELQAELSFGIENSTNQTVDGFLSLVGEFRTPAWGDVERYLVAQRQSTARVEDPVSQRLQAVVSNELEYVYASWNGDWVRALEKARAVGDLLEGGSELRPYRAWWFYLASAAAHRAGAGQTVVEDLLSRSTTCAPGLAFFFRGALGPFKTDELADAMNSRAALNATHNLARLGAVGSKFNRNTQSVLNELASADAKLFGRGLDELGRLLGFDVFDRGSALEQKAIPDSIWHLEHRLILCWEAKSNDTGCGPIPIEDVRQARLHVDWCRANLKAREESIVVVLSSPRTTLDSEAVKYCAGIRYISPVEAAQLGQRVVSVLTQVRSETTGASDEFVAASILDHFRRARLLPNELVAALRLLGDVPVPAETPTIATPHG